MKKIIKLLMILLILGSAASALYAKGNSEIVPDTETTQPAGDLLQSTDVKTTKSVNSLLSRWAEAIQEILIDESQILWPGFDNSEHQIMLVSTANNTAYLINSQNEDIAAPDELVEYSSRSLEETNHVMASLNTDDSREKILEILKAILDSQPNLASGIQASGLTPRENTIVRLVTTGYTNKQIADQLFLSAHTVITHRKNITSKLGIKSVSGLTIFAIVNNIITIEEVTSKPDQ